jgi:pyrimidine-specific ribonucleoside hydrolase
MPSRVIVDMDGGIDDALAVILALESPELEVVGVTAVSGNVSVQQATANALRVVELLNRADVWIAQGLTRPLIRTPIRAFTFHGRDGLGDSHLSKSKLQKSRKSALSMIHETLHTSKRHGLTLICTGPLTNIAKLFARFPDTKRMVREIVFMGGAFGVTEYGFGNETPVAEFNIYSDPEAARIVFQSGVELKAVGLDVTTIPELELSKDDYSLIRKATGPVAKFASRILESNIRAHGRFALHDPLAVGTLIKPRLYDFSNYRVMVETKGEHTTGMTIADRRRWMHENKLLGSPVKVCSGIDLGFKRLFLDHLLAS